MNGSHSHLIPVLAACVHCRGKHWSDGQGSNELLASEKSISDAIIQKCAHQSDWWDLTQIALGPAKLAFTNLTEPSDLVLMTAATTNACAYDNCNNNNKRKVSQGQTDI